MTDKAPSEAVTQQDVDDLLKQLKDLREQIREVQVTTASLETDLQQALDEFDSAVGDFRRQNRRLREQVNNLKDQIKSLYGNLSESEPYGTNHEVGNIQVKETLIVIAKEEAICKDMLLEYLLKVLDPEDDANLFANLQSLCQDSTVSLAEVLEQSPWERVWQARAVQETIIDQYRRLEGWKLALIRQLEKLERQTRDRFQEDTRYGIWQRRQGGSEAWQLFLQQYTEDLEDEKHELDDELTHLLEELEQLRSSSV